MSKPLNARAICSLSENTGAELLTGGIRAECLASDCLPASETAVRQLNPEPATAYPRVVAIVVGGNGRATSASHVVYAHGTVEPHVAVDFGPPNSQLLFRRAAWGLRAPQAQCG